VWESALRWIIIVLVKWHVIVIVITWFRVQERDLNIVIKLTLLHILTLT
jgi:hypothetical protein